jgi:hypothetical protein
MIRKAPRRWPSAKAQSEISEPNPYRARNRQPQIIDDGIQPKPAIFALSRACIARGTGSSNPSPSSRESGELSVPKRRDPICPKAELEDRQALFVVNLAPREMAGQISEAMLLDIGYADGITPVLAIPEQPIPNGVRAG